jgi:hypothetical protein
MQGLSWDSNGYVKLTIKCIKIDSIKKKICLSVYWIGITAQPPFINWIAKDSLEIFGGHLGGWEFSN